jgi:hypothetical protein
VLTLAHRPAQSGWRAAAKTPVANHLAVDLAAIYCTVAAVAGLRGRLAPARRRGGGLHRDRIELAFVDCRGMPMVLQRETGSPGDIELTLV